MNTSIKRIAYILCTLLTLAIFSSSSHAEWVQVADTSNTTFYVDASTMRRNGDIVKFWVLGDYKSIRKPSTNKNYLSDKVQYLVNCKEEITMMVYASDYSGQMGKGETLNSITYKNQTWDPFAPGTARASFSTAVCDATK